MDDLFITGILLCGAGMAACDDTEGQEAGRIVVGRACEVMQRAQRCAIRFEFEKSAMTQTASLARSPIQCIAAQKQTVSRASSVVIGPGIGRKRAESVERDEAGAIGLK